MSRTFDVAVIGLGGHGAAIADHTARRGLRVLGLERFDIGHAMGSSHGIHRLFRLAYAEGAMYVPLLARAAELWEDLERRSGERLFVRNGVLVASPDGDGKVARARAASEAHGIAHEMLDAAAINRRFPAFRLARDIVGLFQPKSGFVLSERAIAAHLISAQVHRAELRARTEVFDINDRGSRIEIRTPAGVYECGQVVVAAGAWIGKLAPPLERLHMVNRRAIGFFAPRRPLDFTPAHCPGFSLSNGRLAIYGFPICGFPGVKIGRDGHLGETGDPDNIDRRAGPRDEAALREGLEAFLNEVDGPALALHGCLITDTPDGHFILDSLPGVPGVHIASACSGHGYKFASVVGEIMADRVQGRADRFDLEPFRLARFGARPAVGI
jgi:sarcosine oxidase